jgi:hypothetical protein
MEKKDLREAIKKNLGVETPEDLDRLLKSFPEFAEYEQSLPPVAPRLAKQLSKLKDNK